MPARRPTRPAPPDVDALRTALGQGKVVRVGIAPSGQFPDGVTGRVRRIGDPAIDGDEFLFVEVPVGGSKDVLPFAAHDLTGPPSRRTAGIGAGGLPVTAAAGGRPPVKPRGRSASPARTPGAPLELVPAHGRSASSPTLSAVPREVSGSVASSTPPSIAAAASAVGSGPALVPVADTTPTVTGNAPGPGRSPAPGRGRAASNGRGRRPPVSITISTVGDESVSWRIEAKIGSKSAVRPTVIPPSRVWSIVESLGEPALTAVVHSLLEDHRRATQARADALAAELSSLQAELSSYPDNDSR